MVVQSNNASESKNNKNWHEEDTPWKAEKIFHILQKNEIKPNSVCEIGCGAGGVLFHLSKYFDENVIFSGYETTNEGYEICKTKVQHNIKYYNNDLLKEDKYFDLVMAINVFTRVRDYLGFLINLKQKGKYKVFHIPLQVTLYTVLRSRYFQNKDYIQSHLHHFNKDTALGTLKGTGYKIIDWFYTADSLELPHHGRKENLWKLPKKILYAINQDFTVKTLGGFSLMVLAE